MNKILITLFGIVFTSSVTASSLLSNKDSNQYKLLLNSSESCFSGTHTQINGNTTTSVSDGWACLNEQKPAIKLEKDKEYIIKNGQIQAR
jgi:hypothetical protein